VSKTNILRFPRRRGALPRINSRRFDTPFALLTAVIIHDRRRRGEIDPDTAATYLAALRQQP